MSRYLMMLCLAMLTAGWTCVPPTPQPPDVVVPDADPFDDAGTPCSSACAKLAALGCPEGGPHCVPTCEHVLSSRITPFDTDCIVNAPSVTAVRLCPAIRCE